jgi:hypothetical protein
MLRRSGLSMLSPTRRKEFRDILGDEQNKRLLLLASHGLRLRVLLLTTKIIMILFGCQKARFNGERVST